MAMRSDPDRAVQLGEAMLARLREAGETLEIHITQSDKVLVLGGFQQGKTTWCKTVLGMMDKVWAWDPCMELDNGIGSLDEAWRVFEATGRAVYQPESTGDFEDWCALALRTANTMVYVDEPNQVMTAGRLPENFSRVQRLGHKRGSGLMLSTHRFADLPPIARMVHHLVVFKQDLPLDLDTLEGYVPGASLVVPRLERHEWLYKGTSGMGVKPPLPLGHQATPTPPPPPAPEAAPSPAPEGAEDGQEQPGGG